MISWNRYIAENDTGGINALLRGYKMPEAQSKQEAAEAISFIVDEKGEDGFNQVFALHPDYDMIIEHYKENYIEPIVEETPKVEPSITPKVSSSTSDLFFSNSIKEILTIVLLFWLVNKVISK